MVDPNPKYLVSLKRVNLDTGIDRQTDRQTRGEHLGKVEAETGFCSYKAKES